MNDACLCPDLMWSLLSTSSWEHCSLCLPASQAVVLLCLIRRCSAVRWSSVALTLRKMEDSHHRGYCTQHSNTQTSKTEDWNTCGLETRAQKTGQEARWQITIYTFLFYFISNHIITAVTCGLLSLKWLLKVHLCHYFSFITNYMLYYKLQPFTPDIKLNRTI